MDALHTLTIHEALAQLEAGAVSSVDLTQALLERLAAVDDRLRAFLRTAPDAALAQAEEADAARAQGEPGALLGVPLAVKDNISVRGMETTCGSKILQGYVPPFDATAIARLKAAGAIILGTTNQDEFAMGSSTENSGYFPTANPWDLARVPGGSSGGSAAAVAACEVPAALGTDTGGSVRQPASLCGLVGLRPTYGRISRYGLIAFASSLDQIGPLTRCVKDAALLTQIMAGADPQDSTCRPEKVEAYTEGLLPEIEGLRVGVPREYVEVEGLQPAVKEAVKTALTMLESLGAELVDVNLPHTEHGIAVYYLIATAEASANLARFDGIRYGYRAEADDLESVYGRTRAEGFGAEVIRRIMLGTYALSAGYYDAYYLQAQKVRTLIRRDFDEAFDQVDVLVGPTSPFTAFRLGERIDDPLQMYLADVFTITQALAGIPAVSVPCGFDEHGLPIGLQIIGPDLAEAQILRVAYAYEQATEWHTRRPNLEEK